MKKYVITGPSSCGKSSVIEHLSKLGYAVIPEHARFILEEGVFHPQKDAFLFQQEIAKRQKEAEALIHKENPDVVFLDRGFYDQVAYCFHSGAPIPEEINLNTKYETAFVLEMLPFFESDGVRVEEDDKEAMRICNEAVKQYQKYHIPIITVPKMSIPERAEFILARIK